MALAIIAIKRTIIPIVITNFIANPHKLVIIRPMNVIGDNMRVFTKPLELRFENGFVIYGRLLGDSMTFRLVSDTGRLVCESKNISRLLAHVPDCGLSLTHKAA